MSDLIAGQIFRVKFPFIKEEIFIHDENLSRETWRPGVGYRLVYPDDAEAVCNGWGFQILEVVSTHRPGKFPERVFYTQKWEDPDGKVFGKNKCRIITKPAFIRRTMGYGVIADMRDHDMPKTDLAWRLHDPV